MRRFDLAKLEIWTSSPAQIAITPTINGRGNRTEHRPDGLIYLTGEDAESLRNFILGHRQTPVTTSIVSATN